MTDRHVSSFHRVLPLYIVIFIAYIGYSLKLTVIVPMILHDRGEYLSSLWMSGHHTIVLGVILSLYPMGQFLGAPVLGTLSDRYGRRGVLLASLLVASACYGVLAAALTLRNLPLFMVVSFIAGLAEANIVIAQGAIADVSMKDNRTRLFGYIYLSAGLAYVLGPLVAGRLADPAIVSWFDYSTPYWAVFILLVLTLILVSVAFRETRERVSRAETNFLRAFTNLKLVFAEKGLRNIFLVNFLIYLAIFGFFRSYPMYLVDEFKLNVREVADMFALLVVPIVVGNLWLTGFISKRCTPRTMSVAASLLMGVFILLVVLPGSMNWLWIPVLLTGLALAVAFPACAAMVSCMVGSETQGRVMGANQSVQVGAETLSGVMAGVLAAAVFELPVIVFALSAILAAVLIVLLFRPAGARYT